MPIKNRTDEAGFDPGRAFATAFTLAKGEINQNKGPGQPPFIDLEYFRFRPRPGFEYLEDAFVKVYGAEPQVIPNILLTRGTTDLCFPSWFEQWARNNRGDSALMRRCDGELQVKWLDKETGDHSFEPIPCVSQYHDPEIPDAQACSCKPSGRLTFLPLDLLPYTSPVYGLMTLNTFDEVITITNYLRGIERLMLSTPGTDPENPLAGLVFNLRRVPFVRTQKYQGRNGKTQTKEVTMYMVRLETSMQTLPVLQSGLPARSLHSALRSPEQEAHVEDVRRRLGAGRQSPPPIPEEPPDPTVDDEDFFEGEYTEEEPPNLDDPFELVFDSIVLTQPVDKKSGKPSLKKNGEPNLTYTLMVLNRGYQNPILFESSLLVAAGLDAEWLQQQDRGKKVHVGTHTAIVTQKETDSGKIVYTVQNIRPGGFDPNLPF